jgi:hypothetical protein
MHHTIRDTASLIAQGVDPDSRQPRERATSCRVCRAETWHLRGLCDSHYQSPAATVLRRTVRGAA